MRIVPRFKKEQNNPRLQELEKRKTETQRRKRRRIRQKLKAANALRNFRQKRRFRNNKFQKKKAGIKVPNAMKAKVASKAVPVIGWAMLLADLILWGGELARKYKRGDSDRLIKSTDAHTMWGLMDEEAAANADILQQFESDEGMLRAIGQEKKLNSSMMLLAQSLKVESEKRMIGADMIDRDPYFDSASSLTDRLLSKIRGVDLKGQTDDTIRRLKEFGYGKINSGR